MKTYTASKTLGIYVRTYLCMPVCIYLITFIFLDLDAKMKSSVFSNKSLGTYSMGNRYTGHI